MIKLRSQAVAFNVPAYSEFLTFADMDEVLQATFSRVGYGPGLNQYKLVYIQVGLLVFTSFVNFFPPSFLL